MSHPRLTIGVMNGRRLILIDESTRIWKLDPATRRRGIEGVARARAALAGARPSWDRETAA